MSKCVFLMQGDGKLVEMIEQQYASEDILQQIVAKYPNLLAGENGAVAGNRKWLLITREAAVSADEQCNGRWSLDHLFVDSGGVPTLVEVKRSADTRIRREVVGQMLDYAANAILYWPIERVRLMFEEQCEAESRDPEACLQELLAGTCDVESFWRSVKTNLQAGRIRMVFLADQIPTELRRIIEFLNTQMDPAEVLGIELKQYVGSDVKTLVPSLIGQTAEAENRKSQAARERRKWDEPSFMAELGLNTDAESVSVAKKILDWITPQVTRVWYGEGRSSGSFVPILNHQGVDHQLFAVWTYSSVEIYFQYYKAPFYSEEKRKELANRLNEINSVSISGEMLTKRPSISLAILKDPADLKKLFAAFEWMITQIKEL